MKKTLILLLALTILASLVLTGCGKNEDAPILETPAPTEVPTAPPETPVPTAEIQEVLDVEEENVYTVEDEVLVDNDEIFFSIKNAQQDEEGNVYLFINAENRTAETLSFMVPSATVNYVAFDPDFYMELEPNSKGKGRFIFNGDGLAFVGVDTVDRASFTLTVVALPNSDGPQTFSVETLEEDQGATEPVIQEETDTRVVFQQEFTIYPTDTGDIKPPEEIPFTNEVVLVDNDSVKAKVVSTESDLDGNFVIRLWFANRSSKVLTFDAFSPTYDGKSCSSALYDRVILNPGEQGYGEIVSFSDDLEALGINVDAVRTVEFDLEITDNDDWAAKPVVSERFEFSI